MNRPTAILKLLVKNVHIVKFPDTFSGYNSSVHSVIKMKSKMQH